MWRILALAGLLTAGTAWAAEKAPEVAILKEWKGFYATQEKPKRIVVEDQHSWETVWSAMEGNVQPKPETPKVDFAKNRVIAVFMGMRRSGGYSVKITSIEQTEKLLVKVQQSQPPRGAMVTMALTSPYHVVVVPKSDKPIEFVDEKQ